jgi:hypothetical protein
MVDAIRITYGTSDLFVLFSALLYERMPCLLKVKVFFKIKRVRRFHLIKNTIKAITITTP